MTTTIEAVFDGRVFRPKEPEELPADVTCSITIESDSDESDTDDDEHPLTKIGRLATDMGVTDLAENHDWYAHQRVSDLEHGE